MPRGGARPGAGRKPGAAWAEKKPPAAREIARAEVAKVLASSKSPLAILCEIAADETRDPILRVQAATAVCPFLYPRLSAAVVADMTPPKEDRPTTQALLGKLSAAFGRLAAPEAEPVAIDAECEPVPEAIEHEE
jgi:hypothetical protein